MTIAQSDMIQVDWVAFAREIKARKLSLGKIAYGIGRSHDYLTGKSRNDAPLPFEDVKKIEDVYGIKVVSLYMPMQKNNYRRVANMPIIEGKLLIQAYRRNLNLNKISDAIGMSHQYLYNICKKARDNQTQCALPSYVVQRLEDKFGICYDDIKPDTKTQAETQVEPQAETKSEEVEPLKTISAAELAETEFDSVDKLMDRFNGFKMNILNGIDTANEFAGEKKIYNQSLDLYTNKIVAAILSAIQLILINIDIY